MEYIISHFKSISDKSPTEMPIQRLLDGIKTGEYKEKVLELRGEPDSVKKDKIKRSLQSVTISGVFKNGHKAENLKKHTGLIQIDIDDVPDLKKAITSLINDPYTFACFISPSGNGIKVIVKIQSIQSIHLQNFRELEEYYQKQYNITIDKSCKDVSRLMYVSYDEDLFYNPDSLQWSNSNEDLFNEALKQVSKTESFIEGKRNDFVFKLACKCRERGITFNYALSQIIKNYQDETFLEKEITTTVSSAFNSQSIKINESKREKKEGQSLLARVENYLSNKYDIRFNIVNTKIEFRVKDSNERFIELNENSIYRELSHNNLELPMNKLSALLGSDYAEQYDPFHDYFENIGKWEEEKEIDFIDKLTTYLPIKDKERFKVQFKKMLVRTIACALDHRVFNKQVFIFVHDMQNSGKSTFCRWLCPPKLSNYIAENINTDKDSLIAIATNFLINMDELATLSRTEIGTLKSFISKDKINARLPYGRKTTILPRRASFIGSTNKEEFLTDETGSVRWLCFELVDKIDFNYKVDLNIDDIYRQAYTLYLNGFEYQLTIDEIQENEQANKKYQENTIEVELISKFYKPSTKESGGNFITPADVQKYINSFYPLAKLNHVNIGKALKILGFKKVNLYHSDKGFSIKGYYVEEKSQQIVTMLLENHSNH